MRCAWMSIFDGAGRMFVFFSLCRGSGMRELVGILSHWVAQRLAGKCPWQPSGAVMKRRDAFGGCQGACRVRAAAGGRKSEVHYELRSLDQDLKPCCTSGVAQRLLVVGAETSHLCHGPCGWPVCRSTAVLMLSSSGESWGWTVNYTMHWKQSRRQCEGLWGRYAEAGDLCCCRMSLALGGFSDGVFWNKSLLVLGRTDLCLLH
jgi:hypothetical protein